MMGNTPKHSVSVAGIVVRDDGRVLVIRRDDNGHWEAPGGVLELRESFEDGVRREVLEETGLEVTVERLTGVYKNLAYGIVALVYRCRPAEGITHPTSEAREVRWMTREEVQSAMTPAFAVRVQDAFDEGAHSRAHDGVDLAPGC
jgi:8-oxo-dGTP diphosphatase